MGTPAKSPPKAPLSVPAQPLKAQYTGQSTMSTATTTSRQAKTKTTSAALSSPKTPAGGSRPKTPGSTNLRPKTPSSGLFAPTAASLARARNAAPQLPTPTKKATLSNAAAERLSKPTAASMSKARNPTASPPKSIAKTPSASRVGASQGAVKSKGSSSATTAQKTASSAPDAVLEGEHPENGYTVEVLDSTEDIDAEAESDGERHDKSVEIGGMTLPEHSATSDAGPPLEEHATTDVQPGHERSTSHGSAKSSATPPAPEHESQPESEVVPSSETVAEGSDMPSEAVVVEKSDMQPEAVARAPGTEDTQEDVSDQSKLHAHVGDDIEDMVQLLESVTISRARSSSIASIPDEVHEIPDEE
jgi:hypothetical protein